MSIHESSPIMTRLAICVDENYSKIAVTLFEQVLTFDKLANQKYFIEILTTESQNLEILETELKLHGFNFCTHRFKADYIADELENHAYPRTAYVKLELGNLELTPGFVFSKDLIYLDVDILLLEGLAKIVDFAAENLPDKAMLATTETWATHIHHELISGIENYFNTGVLVIRPLIWKENRITQKAIELVRANGEMLYPDQDYLNLVFKDSALIGDLPKCFNQFFVSRLKSYKAAKIIHFAGVSKPWNSFGWNLYFTKWRRINSKNFKNTRFGLKVMYSELVIALKSELIMLIKKTQA